MTALKLWLSVFAGGLVIIQTDNTTAEAAFDSGTTKGIASMDLLRDAIVLGAAADIKLLLKYLTLSTSATKRT